MSAIVTPELDSVWNGSIVVSFKYKIHCDAGTFSIAASLDINVAKISFWKGKS
jgi:hypothetical protein